jgi:hypothetical protein
MFYIDYGDFLNNSISFGFNFVWQKTLFIAFLTFHELQDSEKGKLREHGLEILR